MKIYKSIREVEIDVQREIEQQITNLIFKTHAHIVQNTPVDTGRLRSSITVESRPNEWIIGTNVPYAEAVDMGVAPHTIRPKNKKALYWKGAAHPVKRVESPGFEGFQMFARGIDFFEAELRKLK
jgi:hypothetical protein